MADERHSEVADRVLGRAPKRAPSPAESGASGAPTYRAQGAAADAEEAFYRKKSGGDPDPLFDYERKMTTPGQAARLREGGAEALNMGETALYNERPHNVVPVETVIETEGAPPPNAREFYVFNGEAMPVSAVGEMDAPKYYLFDSNGDYMFAGEEPVGTRYGTF